MLRYEDVLAARFLERQAPDRRADVDRVLDAMGAAERTPRSLLAELVSRGVLSMEQARFVHGRVEGHKRERARGIYAALLRREGLEPAVVERCLGRAGPEGGIEALGEAACALAGLAPDREHQLRYQARLAFDRDVAEQLRRGARPARPGRPTGSPSPSAPAAPAGRAAPSAEEPVPLRPEEASQIVRHTLSEQDGELPGPAFRVPDWVDMADPRTGSVVAGFRILGRIGAGAMGVVYLADRQDEPERPVALKLLPSDATPEAKGRFKRGIVATGLFSHPGVLDLYDAGEAETGEPYLAMEFVDGRDLSAVLEAEGRLPPRRALALAGQVFAALGACHAAGVVHRDVKPDNVIVQRDGVTAKLMDFGVAVVRDLGDLEDRVFRSFEGGLTGTPAFMSPEQVAGEELTGQSDLYSMGLVLYQMLAGRLPFESETPRGFLTCHLVEDPLPLAEACPAARDLPPDLQALVARLLDKDPANRPATGEEVAAVLEASAPQIGEAPRRGGSLWSFLGWGRS